jgi:tetracycline resistance efflux pump
MQNSFASVIPPFLVLVTACITRKLNPSLIAGLVSAALIATNASIFGAATLLYTRFLEKMMDIDTFYSYAFLIIVGSIITLVAYTGGVQALAKMVAPRLKKKSSAERYSFFLSMLLFIDDYLSNLTVGTVMRPLTDHVSIPRSKLAFLVHSLSGPLVILVPVSSWVAMITSNLHYAGVGQESTSGVKIFANPFFIYISSIPFIFYSLILIASIWFIIHFQISFGPMQEHEYIAAQNGNLLGGKPSPVISKPIEHNQNGTLFDLVFPLATLIFGVIFGILYNGDCFLFGGTNSIMEALQQNNNTFAVLFCAGLISLILSLITSLIRARIIISLVPPILHEGFTLMVQAIVMITLASVLGAMLKSDLQTGDYLARTLLHSMSITLLPFAFFMVALITAIMTGTSWGTIALLLPIAIPMLIATTSLPLPLDPSDIPFLFPVIGAIFSGAVCGDHVSPISETTIMAATSTLSYPLDHAYTQIFYALPVIICTSIAFLISGQLTGYAAHTNALISLSVGLGLCCILLIGIHMLYKNNKHQYGKKH